MDYDVIIIGSGLSGLAAGIRLAQFDTRVLIVEKHTVAGIRITSEKTGRSTLVCTP